MKLTESKRKWVMQKVQHYGACILLDMNKNKSMEEKMKTIYYYATNGTKRTIPYEKESKAISMAKYFEKKDKTQWGVLTEELSLLDVIERELQSAGFFYPVRK